MHPTTRVLQAKERTSREREQPRPPGLLQAERSRRTRPTAPGRSDPGAHFAGPPRAISTRAVDAIVRAKASDVGRFNAIDRSTFVARSRLDAFNYLGEKEGHRRAEAPASESVRAAGNALAGASCLYRVRADLRRRDCIRLFSSTRERVLEEWPGHRVAGGVMPGFQAAGGPRRRCHAT